MSLILNIDTSGTMASVSIGRHGKLLGIKENEAQSEHASFLQPAIKQLLDELQTDISDLDAVAVVNGPGSYTGLRVGLASAKGICYALGKPLLTIGTLPLMAYAAKANLKEKDKANTYLCPMIDARRQEVFTAIYNADLEIILPAQAHILVNDSFVATLLQNRTLFFGNGAPKFQLLTNQANAMFAGVYDNSTALCELSYKAFLAKDFTELAYSEPLYLKEFYNGV